MPIIDTIQERKIIGIIRLDDLAHAVELAQALIAGGITILEFTLTNPDAVRTIASVKAAVGETAIIGAGSVITAKQVHYIADHGAEFVISPVTNASVIEACHQRGLPTIPGAYTPTEIQQAWEMEVTAVKVFPAGGLGHRYIRDVLAPLPHLRLVPTGSVDLSNIKAFFDAGAFAVGIGSAMFNTADVIAQRWLNITNAAKKYYEIVR